MEEGTVNQMVQAMGRMTNASIMMAGGLEKKRKQELENHVKRLKEMPEQQMYFSTIGYFLMDELIRHCAFDATAYRDGCHEAIRFRCKGMGDTHRSYSEQVLFHELQVAFRGTDYSVSVIYR